MFVKYRHGQQVSIFLVNLYTINKKMNIKPGISNLQVAHQYNYGLY